jgi:2-polyprenyl-6-hydroxyphenyl methylase/3-demethylubiquinone-9 3-methyltransferase
MSAATINPHEAAHFGALAADWWDPHGSSAMLHKLNPVRLAYIRAQIDAHWHVDARERYALAGRSAIDVGCGAGLLAEPLARMGAKVTGVDAAPENIAAAQRSCCGAGAASTKLADYHAGEVELAGANEGCLPLDTRPSIWSPRWKSSSMSPIPRPSSANSRRALRPGG